MHLRWGHAHVRIAQIPTASLLPRHLALEFANGTVNLPVLTSQNGATFVSMDAIRTHLGVAPNIGQQSEWFALEIIPRNMYGIMAHWP